MLYTTYTAYIYSTLTMTQRRRFPKPVFEVFWRFIKWLWPNYDVNVSAAQDPIPGHASVYFNHASSQAEPAGENETIVYCFGMGKYSDKDLLRFTDMEFLRSRPPTSLPPKEERRMGGRSQHSLNVYIYVYRGFSDGSSDWARILFNWNFAAGLNGYVKVFDDTSWSAGGIVNAFLGFQMMRMDGWM